MKKHLLPETGRFYKANLHCHTTISDGRLTPLQIKDAYTKQGYSVVAFTDHDIYVDHSNLCDEGFVAINSYEADISDWVVEDSRFRRCYHFCCYDRSPEKNKTTLEPRPDYRDIDAINEYIKALNERGFLVCYNHANWSLQTPYDYKELRGLFACEIYNHSAWIEGIDGNHETVYDMLLRQGGGLSCVAADDNHNQYPFGHPRNDSFGGYVMIKTEKLEYKSILTALESGSFYASMGPEITQLYTENNTLYVSCSPVDTISMTTSGRRSERARAERGESLESAAFSLQPDDGYVRLQLTDHNGLRANSNAYFI